MILNEFLQLGRVPWLANTHSTSVPSIALLLGDAHVLELLAGWEVKKCEGEKIEKYITLLIHSLQLKFLIDYARFLKRPYYKNLSAFENNDLRLLFQSGTTILISN